jgi:hypothetical protein
LYNDKVKLEITPVPLQQYTEERMYPPIHNFTNDNTLVYGESYGNGVYELSASSHWRLPDFATYNLFLSSIVKIWHGATRYTSNGIYNGSDYIVPGYLGDWIKIKLPRPIKLTKYGLSLTINPIERAPGKYKLYGSNDGTNWDVLVHKRNTISYDTSFSFEERVNVNNQYQYFGLVINELVGNITYLNLETLYIYGKEFISEEPEYKTLAFTYNSNGPSYPVIDADAASLVAWYKFDSGEELTDSVGNSVLTIYNGTSDYQNGKINESLNITDSGYKITSTTLVNLFEDVSSYWSVSFWYDKSTSTIPNKSPFISRYDDGGVSPRGGFEISINTNGTFLMERLLTSGAWITATTTYQAVQNQWVNIVYTCQPNLIRIYVDGILNVEETTNLSYASTSASHNELIGFGLRLRSNIVAVYTSGHGYLEDFRIYDKALSATEISDLYNQYSQTSYTVNFPEDTECDILIVGGGGGGGGVEEPATSGSGGGGGGGGVIFLQNQTISTGSYIIKVGKGGKGYDIADSTRQTGERGYNSSFNYIQTEAIGGGGGGTRGISFLSQGLEGGSGGGSSHTNGSTDTPGGLGTVVNLLKADGTVLIENYRQGYNGGTTVYESPYSGGGGGAGGNGFGSADTPDDSAGGIGRAEENGVDFKTYFNIASGIGEHHTDSKVYFAGGGASGYRSNDANHSNGGLGGGGSSSNGPSENGVANTGGGGGGARSGTAGTIQTGGNGGSGIVIIRYKTQYQATTHGAQWTYHSANPNTHHYGNVGIGTTASATQKLLVNGDMNVTGNYKQNDNTIGNWYKAGTSIYRASGNVGIGNTDPRYSLHVHGGVYAGEGGTTGDGTTVWTSTSDSRMKDNIFKASYKECYDIFKKIELYRYNFKPGHVNSNDRNQLGFIAQEVQQQIPNSVEPRSIRLSSGVYIHDILTLNVTQINYILYGTFKYLIAELDIIKKHLESQEEAGQTE